MPGCHLGRTLHVGPLHLRANLSVVEETNQPVILTGNINFPSMFTHEFKEELRRAPSVTPVCYVHKQIP